MSEIDISNIGDNVQHEQRAAYINTDSGNFETIQLMLLNEQNELLVEVKAAEGFGSGMIIVPGRHILEEDDKKDGKHKEEALKRISSELYGINPNGENVHLCSLEYIENDKFFTCHYYFVKGWEGEVQKLAKDGNKNMWVAVDFAPNLLSADADKQALSELKKRL